MDGLLWFLWEKFPLMIIFHFIMLAYNQDILICDNFTFYPVAFMMTSSNGNMFCVTGKWHGALMLSLICIWINGWINNCGAGDLRCHCAHYDVIVMYRIYLNFMLLSLIITCLTHWGQNKMGEILETTYPDAFCWMKYFKFVLRFQWNFLSWMSNSQ